MEGQRLLPFYSRKLWYDVYACKKFTVRIQAPFKYVLIVIQFIKLIISWLAILYCIMTKCYFLSYRQFRTATALCLCPHKPCSMRTLQRLYWSLRPWLVKMKLCMHYVCITVPDTLNIRFSWKFYVSHMSDLFLRWVEIWTIILFSDTQAILRYVQCTCISKIMTPYIKLTIRT